MCDGARWDAGRMGSHLNIDCAHCGTDDIELSHDAEVDNAGWVEEGLGKGLFDDVSGGPWNADTCTRGHTHPTCMSISH